MASVQINIPGIGNIVADNAATEETLQKILTAMQGKGAGGRGGATGGGQMSPGTLKEQEKETEARKKNTKASEDSTKQTKSSGVAAEAASKYVKGLGAGVKTGATQVGNALIGFGSTLAQTAAAVATSFATSYDSMAENPIGAAATMMATNIDLAGAAAKATIDVAAGLGTMAAGVLGPFSGVATGFINAVSTAAKAVVDFATTILKMANEILSKEFQKSADALKEYTKVGASFAGGMMEMRDIAHDSGMGIKQLTAAAVASSEEIRNMGLTQGEGARVMAQGAKSLATTLGKSGGSMRDELLALGYTYEEQAGLVAQYGAQLKASGQDIKNLAPSELARQTKDYAVNLKVISDITGQDAKKLMEKARSESMRGALNNKLDKDQRENFTKAHATLAKYGPEVQNALIQQLAGGTITDSKIAANADLVQMIQEIAGNVQQAGGDIVESTGKSMGEARQRLEQSSTAQATDLAAALGSTGLPAAMAGITNNILASGFTPEMATQSRKDAIAQSEATDGLTKGYQSLTAQMTGFQNQMEKFATNNLPAYASILAKNAAETMALFQEGVVAAADFTAYVKKKIDEVEGAVKDKAPSKDKVGDALVGASAGAVTGAVVGSLVPVIGTAVGAAVGGLVGGTIGWFKGNTAQNAEGGLATPGKLNIFGEAGPEAAVPLPDGRSIPVSFDTDALTKMATGGNDQVMQDLADAIKQLSTSMSSGTSSSSPMEAIARHLEEMKETASKQLDINSTLNDLMGQSNSISNNILNNSY